MNIRHILGLLIVPGRKLCHWPRGSRIRWHVCGIGVGASIMLFGSTLAANSHTWCDSSLPATAVHTVGFLLHGIGACPILGHIEPLWATIFPE